MPTRYTYHPAADCGCTATSFYSWSDNGLFDDGDTIVDECAWHRTQTDAFHAWLDNRNRRSDAYWRAGDTAASIALMAETYDEAHWVQVIDRQDETDRVVFEAERATRDAAAAIRLRNEALMGVAF